MNCLTKFGMKRVTLLARMEEGWSDEVTMMTTNRKCTVNETDVLH